MNSGGNLLIARSNSRDHVASGGGGGGGGSGLDRDRAEFAKFCKFFTIRVVQAVVQSRTGRKIRSQSRVVGQPTDWFNVSVDELQEVNDELKRALDGQYLAATSSTRTICLLISLRTIDGDTLHLEVWQLSLDTEQCDPSISVRSHLYHRMGVLLRSAIAASRVTPTYKLYARRQGSDSFVLRYQISSSPVQLQILGEGAKSVDLGFVASPFGMVRLAVHYRTKMVISESRSQLRGALQENYYDATGEKTLLFVKPKEKQSRVETDENQQDPLSNLLPWAPLPEPDAYKLPPLQDFSPCFSTFSTSPLSGDFPYSPSPARRQSVVAFHLGGGATSCSSSEEGGSGSHGQLSIGGHASGSTTAGPLVPVRGQPEENIPKRNSSGTLFKMELSGAGIGGGATSPKPSSFPDQRSGIEFRVGGGRGSLTTVRRDTFPFAHLLSSCSAPNFGGVSAGLSGQYQLHHHASLGGVTTGFTVTSSNALLKYSPKRRAVPAVLEEHPTTVAESDENLESSREVMVADGVKIIEKRRRKKSKQKKHQSEIGGGDGTSGGGENEGDQQSSSESESSCDDSFVRYEMRPVFATGSDLGAFFNQCKLAPPELKSFTAVFAQPLTAVNPVATAATSETTTERASVAVTAAAFVRRSLEDIPERLKTFEEHQKIFDDFVKSLKVDSSSEDETEAGGDNASS